MGVLPSPRLEAAVSIQDANATSSETSAVYLKDGTLKGAYFPHSDSDTAVRARIIDTGVTSVRYAASERTSVVYFKSGTLYGAFLPHSDSDLNIRVGQIDTGVTSVPCAESVDGKTAVVYLKNGTLYGAFYTESGSVLSLVSGQLDTGVSSVKCAEGLSGQTSFAYLKSGALKGVFYSHSGSAINAVGGQIDTGVTSIEYVQSAFGTTAVIYLKSGTLIGASYPNSGSFSSSSGQIDTGVTSFYKAFIVRIPSETLAPDSFQTSIVYLKTNTLRGACYGHGGLVNPGITAIDTGVTSIAYAQSMHVPEPTLAADTIQNSVVYLQSEVLKGALYNNCASVASVGQIDTGVTSVKDAFSKTFPDKAGLAASSVGTSVVYLKSGTLFGAFYGGAPSSPSTGQIDTGVTSVSFADARDVETNTLAGNFMHTSVFYLKSGTLFGTTWGNAPSAPSTSQIDTGVTSFLNATLRYHLSGSLAADSVSTGLAYLKGDALKWGFGSANSVQGQQMDTGVTSVARVLFPGPASAVYLKSDGPYGAFADTTARTRFLDPAAPSAPTGVTRIGFNTTTITWGWNAVAGALSYNVFSATGPSPVFLANVPPNNIDSGLDDFQGNPIIVNGYAQTNLSTNTVYAIRVSVIGLSGDSALSSTSTWATASAVPADLKVTARTAQGISISWNENGNPPGTIYQVYVSTTDAFVGGVNPPIHQVISVARGLTLTGGSTTLFNLLPGTTHWITMESVNVLNQVAQYSNIASTRTFSLAPRLPLDFSGTVLSTFSIRWSWTDIADDEEGFRVVTSTGGRISPDLPPDSDSYIETGLLPNQQAARKVQTFHSAGSSNSATVSVYTLPNPPSDLSLSVFITSITLSWGANSNQGSPAYEVSFSADNFVTSFSTPVVFSSNLTSRTTSFPGLTPASTYYLRLRTQGGEGAISDFSQTAGTMTLPAPPLSLSFLSVSTDSLRIGWNANQNPSSVRFIADLSTGALPNSFSGNKSSTTFLDSASLESLLPNTTYFLQVKAQRSDGVQSSSISGSTATLANIPGPMQIPTVSSTSLTFSFDSNFNPTDTLYQVQISTSSDFSPLARASLQIQTTSGQFSSLTANTTYYLRARGINRRGVFTDFDVPASTTTRSAPPTGVSGTPLSVFSIFWTWNAITGALSYNVYSAGSNPSLLSNVQTNSFTQTDLSTNTVYSIQVAAINASGESALSSPVSTATLSAPPIDLTVVSRASRRISIGWDENTNPTGTQYEVYFSTDDFTLNFSTPIPLSKNLTGNSTSVLNLTPDTDYWIKLRSFNVLGVADGFSNIVTTRTLPTPPNAPSSLSAVALTTTSIHWTWTDNSNNELGFRLYASTGGLYSGDLAADETSFVQTGLTPDTPYQAFMRAFGAVGTESDDSNAVTRYTLADAPSGLSVDVVSRSSSSLKVLWSTSAASGYGLERSTFSSGGFSQIASPIALLASTSFYFNTGLSAKTTYYYRLRGFNGDSIGTDYIGPDLGFTKPPLPGAPLFSGVAVSTESIFWSWNTPSDAAGFVLISSAEGVIADLAADATSYLELGLSSGTAYSRRIKAVNETGFTLSNLATPTTPEAQYRVLAVSFSSFTAGNAALEIPEGALGGDGEILLSEDPRTKPLLDTAASDITVADAALSPSVKAVPNAIGEFLAIVGGSRKTTNFASQVTVGFSYPDSDDDGIVDGVSPPGRVQNLSVYTLNEATKRWEAVSSQISLSSKTVSAQVSHFSVFSLMVVTASSNLSTIKVFPNPFQPGSGGAFDAAGIKFKNLTQEGTIRIFTITGELVRTLQKTAADGDEKVWDGRNEGGQKVASGVYFYLVTNPSGEKIKGRVAIIK